MRRPIALATSLTTTIMAAPARASTVPDRRAPSRVAAWMVAGWAAWLAWVPPALARSAAEDIQRPLSRSELALQVVIWTVLIAVVVFLSNRTWTYDLEHDGDRLLLSWKGDIVHKVALTELASVSLGRKGSGATFVDKDGVKYHVKSQLGPALMEALWKSGVVINGRKTTK